MLLCNDFDFLLFLFVLTGRRANADYSEEDDSSASANRITHGDRIPKRKRRRMREDDLNEARAGHAEIHSASRRSRKNRGSLLTY